MHKVGAIDQRAVLNSAAKPDSVARWMLRGNGWR
jgi:hypothetical protein